MIYTWKNWNCVTCDDLSLFPLFINNTAGLKRHPMMLQIWNLLMYPLCQHSSRADLSSSVLLSDLVSPASHVQYKGDRFPFNFILQSQRIKPSYNI